jgi:hypothetical protein
MAPHKMHPQRGGTPQGFQIFVHLDLSRNLEEAQSEGFRAARGNLHHRRQLD